jgi:hypothetical protein
MKISSDPNHPDFHEVVHFIDQVTLNGEKLNYCVHMDTEKGEADCVIYPIVPVNGFIPTQKWYGKVDIIWKPSPGIGSLNLLTMLKADWEKREATSNEL